VTSKRRSTPPPTLPATYGPLNAPFFCAETIATGSLTVTAPSFSTRARVTRP
jgi:hypothetical protein